MEKVQPSLDATSYTTFSQQSAIPHFIPFAHHGLSCTHNFLKSGKALLIIKIEEESKITNYR
jgi:hypothetical protein